MKIHRAETVIRYQIAFDPHEAEVLDDHPALRSKIHVRPDRGGGRYSRGADAMLTRSEVNDVCDALGVNGREFLSRYDGIATPSSVSVSLGLAL
jgi:hypothetical protein